MRSVNKVILVGNIGRDAETKFTPSGIARVTFSIATSRRWKDGKSGEWKEETDWHNVVAWRAENLASFLTKGKQVYIEGRLQTRNYEKGGEKRYVTEVVSDEVILLGGGEGGRRNERAEADPPQYAGNASSGVEDDDVPF